MKKKNVWRTFGAQGSSVLKTGVFPALAWQKISSLNRSAALSLSKVELPTPLNNCLMIPVLTSFSFRDNSLRSRRCCGGYRSLGVAELYAGTCNRTLVQRWLEVVASSNESSGRERSEVIATHRPTAPQNQIKYVSFTPGAAHFLFKRKWGAHPAAEGGIPRAKPALFSEETQKNMLPSHGIGTRANIRFVVPPKFKTEYPCLLWPPVTGREPWAFPPPLRRCPSSESNETLSALCLSLWIGFQSTAAASAR